MKNQFGKVSSLGITASLKDGKTILTDVQFTAPFKVMQPFARGNGLQVMMLSASAGIMEGDEQRFDFLLEEGASLEFVSQSFEKIHRMKEGCARRRTTVKVGAGATFDFHPLPTIPFEDSAYESVMEVELADESARFGLYEILSCGRSARGERFGYRRYHSLVQIKRQGKWIYRDNTRYEPSRMEMEGLGMYESYTHLSSLFLTAGRLESVTTAQQVQELIDETPDTEGAITRLGSGDYAIRVLGRRAQTLQELTERILGKKAQEK